MSLPVHTPLYIFPSISSYFILQWLGIFSSFKAVKFPTESTLSIRENSTQKILKPYASENNSRETPAQKQDERGDKKEWKRKKLKSKEQKWAFVSN
jgi:hypothetical protein